MNSCLLNGECTSNIPYAHFVLNELIEPASIWINKHTIGLIYFLFWLMVFLMVFWLVEQERAAQAWWQKMSGHITEKKNGRDEFSEPWEYRYQNIPLAFFGGGAVNAFEHYLTRESSVSVTSIDDVVNWLVVTMSRTKNNSVSEITGSIRLISNRYAGVIVKILPYGRGAS